MKLLKLGKYNWKLKYWKKKLIQNINKCYDNI